MSMLNGSRIHEENEGQRPKASCGAGQTSCQAWYGIQVIMDTLDCEQFEQSCRTQIASWQEVLRLQDWKIELEFWPHKALDQSVAKIRSNYNNKSALLILRYPEELAPIKHDWPEGEVDDYDLSIVHELLHLMLRPMECELEWAEEQACNLIAASLVRLYRAHPQGPPTPSPCGDETAHKAVSSGHYL